MALTLTFTPDLLELTIPIRLGVPTAIALS
jgi:hypothetical protein